MDLARRSQLSLEEHLEVAQAMQMVLLDELARNARWKVGDAAFHGGTSISSAWSSQRWSEDLDFLLSKGQRDKLMAAAPKVASGARQRLQVVYPGCAVEFLVKPGDETKDDVMDVWTVKWSHPNRMKKVLVKLEFYSAEPGIMSAYRAVMARPGHAGGSITTTMPVGDLVSLWADKVKVIATRPGLKWRDVHDLGYISQQFDRRGWPDQPALLDALATTAAIYEKTLQDVEEGLSARLDEGCFDKVEDFTMDMGRWFPASLHADFVRKDVFKGLIARAEAEVRRALEIIPEPSAGVYGARP